MFHWQYDVGIEHKIFLQCQKYLQGIVPLGFRKRISSLKTFNPFPPYVDALSIFADVSGENISYSSLQVSTDLFSLISFVVVESLLIMFGYVEPHLIWNGSCVCNTHFITLSHKENEREVVTQSDSSYLPFYWHWMILEITRNQRICFSSTFIRSLIYLNF